MTPYEWVKNYWLNSRVGYDLELDVKTAAGDLVRFRAAGYDVPEDLTAEDFAEWWNELVDEQKKWEAEQDE